MADNLTDGTLEFGSVVISVSPEGGGGSFNVILDNVTVNRPTKVVERTNEIDEPAAQRIYKTFVTGSAQAQVDGSNFIKRLDQFTEDLGDGSENWIITNVSDAYVKDGETKQNIEFRKKINA